MYSGAVEVMVRSGMRKVHVPRKAILFMILFPAVSFFLKKVSYKKISLLDGAIVLEDF